MSGTVADLELCRSEEADGYLHDEPQGNAEEEAGDYSPHEDAAEQIPSAEELTLELRPVVREREGAADRDPDHGPPSVNAEQEVTHVAPLEIASEYDVVSQTVSQANRLRPRDHSTGQDTGFLR